MSPPLHAPTSIGFLDASRQDLRFAWRSLKRHRSFAAVSAATIAIGIAATTTALGVANGVLFKAPPITEPERVVSIWEHRSVNVFESMEGRLIQYRRYEAYRDATDDVFSGLAAHRQVRVAVGSQGGAQAVDASLTSANYFEVLGLTPQLGRLYDRDDDPSVVISDRLWRSRYGADPSIVGSAIDIDSRRFTVGGVATPGFVGTLSTFTVDMWIPVIPYRDLGSVGGSFDDEESALALGIVVPIGRLREGISREVAEARVNELAPRVRAEEDARYRIRGAQLDGIRWRADLLGVLQTGLGTVVAAAVMLLLIACANIAGLVLARSYDRQREVAVRLAMGAGRARIIRQIVTEHLLLFGAGGVLGVLLAAVTTSALATMDIPFQVTLTFDTALDGRVVLAALALIVTTAVLFGAGPGRLASRLDLTTSLKEAAPSGRSARRRSAFVVGQVGVACLLLLIAGLTTRSLLEVFEVDLGFDPSDVVVATIDLGNHGYEREPGEAFFAEVAERVMAVPGVRSVGLGQFVLLSGSNESNGVRRADAEPDAQSVGVYRSSVTPGYFDATRTPILRGRAIGPEDGAGSTPVAVINETLAEQLWAGEDPIGRRFRIGSGEYEVVGVAANGVYAFTFEEPKRFAFYSFAQRYDPIASLHVRADDAGQIGPALRGIVAELDPNVAVENVRTMDEVVSGNQMGPRFLAGATSAFAAIGLLLATLGVYGMLAVHVSQRRREFGVRQALGAQAREILGLVVGKGVGLAAVGCLIGVAGAAALARVLSGLLFGIGALDPLTFVGVPAALLFTAAFAGLRPAVQATRIDPRTALREE